MSFPPPGGPPPPPPPGGPPPPGNPYPPQGYPGPQQPWGVGPVPKKRGNGWKWGLGAIALLVVIGVTAAVTISVTKDDADDGPSPTGETFGLASADDKGPANIITEDPSCAAWGPINDTFVAVQRRGWNKRDPAIPSTDWSPEQRAQYEEVGKAATAAADQTVALAQLTPHRVMREVYEQFIAYARAYSETIATYTPESNYLAGVFMGATATLVYTCAAITYGSAQARGPLIPSPSPPSAVAPLSDPADPRRFMESPDPGCPEWDRLTDKFESETKAWQAIDSAISASDWTPEQRAVMDAVIPVMNSQADALEELALSSSNPVIQDFATLAAQYRRAYAQALPTYVSADAYLQSTSGRLTSLIYQACKAAGA
ncbi:hypothetical protein MGALJ_44060 [Mycobacterium gallinarum]|uniref:Uncharacterized protein n=1 Tax=Mycobacterium gallinarum TaxID=39689 RepID=A0A9W4FGV5_9MYCO|nr:hypothetical protein MGALJ_44060 [Mycobacterium gallinarum]